jgi:EmrB/QacA subfamily drug resistance transporter
VRHRWVALGVVLTAAFMDLMDSTIVTVALPRVQAALGAGSAEAQWILAGYLLTFALGLITGGRLGDIHGRRRVFLIGVAGFVVTSAVCGAAWTPGLLIGARLAQGLFAAIMVPQVMSVILILFEGRDRVRALGLYAATLSLANVSGPILGALLTQGWGWRAIFFVNVPIGILAFVGTWKLMPESRSDQPPRLDLAGAGLISLACFALLFPIVQGRESGWPLWMFVVLLASAPLLAVFAATQRRRGASALVPPELFRHRSSGVGLTGLLLLFSGLASLFLVLTYHLQSTLGWTPLDTAFATIGFPVGIVLSSGIAQRYAATHSRWLIAAGLTVLTADVVTLTHASDFWGVTLPVLGMGIGMGLSVSPLTTVALADVTPDAAGAASGVTNTVIQLGGAGGVAIIGTVHFSLASSLDVLWFNAVVFAIAALLTLFLPREAAVSSLGTPGSSSR